MSNLSIDNLEPRIKDYYLSLSNKKLLNILTKVYEVVKLSPDKINTNVASIIGKKGEDIFENVCKKLPDNYKIHTTAKEGHKGDFVIYYTKNDITLSCIVDVKNYSKPIPSKEIDKLHKDIKYGKYDAGILLSLKSKIPNKRNIEIEDTIFPSKTIPILYLNSDDESLILESIKLLFLKLESNHKVEFKNLLNVINHTIDKSATTRRLINTLKINIDTQLIEIQNHLLSIENELTYTINTFYKDIKNKPVIKISNEVIDYLNNNFVPSSIPLITRLLNISDNNSISDNSIILNIKNDKYIIRALKTKSKIKCETENADLKKYFKKELDLKEETTRHIENASS